MKKSIFDLTKEETKKINLELIRTSYFQRYILSYFLVVLVSTLFGIFITIISDFDKDMILDEGMAMLVIVLFIAIITILFLFKMFDLMKEYYEQKGYEKK